MEIQGNDLDIAAKYASNRFVIEPSSPHDAPAEEIFIQPQLVNHTNQFVDEDECASNAFAKSIPLSNTKTDQKQTNILSLEISQMRRKEKVEFQTTFKRICEMSTGEPTGEMIILQTELLNGMRGLLHEKLAEEESFRHKMLKEKVSKKQWQHSSVLTKTTAANSISSAVPKEQQQLNSRKKREIIVVESNTTSQRCSISMNNLSEMSVPPTRTEYIDHTRNIELAKNECLEQSQMIKTVEQALIPLKNERNQILEHLEDMKEDLIVSKQYLRDATDTMERKKWYCQNLMGRINSLSKSGHSTLNRDYLSQSHIQQLNSTRIMNTSFVDEAVGKFKAVKDFFKGKFTLSSSAATHSNPPLSPQNYGFQSSRMNTQTQIPMTNRFLDFN